ncbi:preprotein translocase subunit YajC [bacterium]|nr:preprotein translocase subunit YajC [bacterium]
MANPGSGGGNPIMAFAPLIMIIVVMYFFMIRPQAKKQKELKAMMENLEKGDKVLTNGGIIGTIQGIKEAEGLIYLKIAENLKIEMTRAAITQVLKKKKEA